MNQNKNRLCKKFWSLLILATFGLSILSPTADARLIFSTEDDGVESDVYTLDVDGTVNLTDNTDLSLNFGANLGANITYNDSTSQFTLNKDVNLDGNVLEDFRVESFATAGAPTCTIAGEAGRMYYDTDVDQMYICTGTGGWNSVEDLGTGSITSAEILDGTITAADLGTDSVDSDEIAADAVTASEIATGAVTTDEILDGTIAAADLANGSVSGGAGGVITDGSITAADLGTDSVGSDEIAADAVTASEIATGAVGTAEIADGSVATGDIANNAIDGTKLGIGTTAGDTLYYNGTDWVRLGIGTAGQVLSTNGAADAPEWADVATTLADLTDTNLAGLAAGNILTYDALNSEWDNVAMSGDGTVSAAGVFDLAADSVTAAEIATGAVGTAEIADGSITTSDLNLAGFSIGSAQITDGSITAADLGTDSVGSDEIAADAVGAAEIATGAVTTAEILDGTIAAADLANGSVSGGAGGVITDGSITAADLGTDSVGSDEIAADAVTASEIATGAVGTAEIADGSVATGDIANNAVDGTKLGIGTTAGDTLYYNGTDWVRLGIGAAGQILATNATTDAVEWVDNQNSPVDVSVSMPPEFPNFTIRADGTENRGTLESDYDVTNNRNYYQWSTRRGTMQDYDLVVQWPIPEDFDGWQAAPLSFDYRTNTATDTDNQIDVVSILDTTGASLTITGDTANLASATWAQANVAGFGAGTFAAGDFITITFKLQSTSGDFAQLGALEFNYSAK